MVNLIVVDGIKNEIQDTYEEKGDAYCGGYAVVVIGTTFAGTKRMEKLAKTFSLFLS